MTVVVLVVIACASYLSACSRGDDLVWSTDDVGLYKKGSEITVNEETYSSQTSPSATQLSNGNIIVVWEDRHTSDGTYDIYGQLYKSTGEKVYSNFVINTYKTDDQKSPWVSALSNGGFVVVWQTSDTNSSSDRIHGQRFSSATNKVGSEFIASDRVYTASQTSPVVMSLPSGGFIVAWSMYNSTMEYYKVHGRVFDSNGAKSGSEFVVNNCWTTSDANVPSMALSSQEEVVLALACNANDGSNKPDVYGQVRGTNGSVSGSLFLVNSRTYQAQKNPTVALLPNGELLFAYQDYVEEDTRYAISGQRFSSSMVKYDEVQLSNSSYSLNEPRIGVFTNSSFIIVYWGLTASTLGQYFGTDGSRIGPEFEVGDYYLCTTPNIIVLSDAAFVLFYECESDIRAQWYYFGVPSHSSRHSSGSSSSSSSTSSAIIYGSILGAVVFLGSVMLAIRTVCMRYMEEKRKMQRQREYEIQMQEQEHKRKLQEDQRKHLEEQLERQRRYAEQQRERELEQERERQEREKEREQERTREQEHEMELEHERRRQAPNASGDRRVVVDVHSQQSAFASQEGSVMIEGQEEGIPQRLNTNNNEDTLKHGIKLEEIGKIDSGANLLGFCKNATDKCLAARNKLPTWINLGYTRKGDEPFLINSEALFICPTCEEKCIEGIQKIQFFNAEYSVKTFFRRTDVIPPSNNYKYTYALKPNDILAVEARKIRQHATSLEDLIERSRKAMSSPDLQRLLSELAKYKVIIAKPDLKGDGRLQEKIEADYDGDFNCVFDIGRFTILCPHAFSLEAAVNVVKSAPEFNMIVSEDKDFFNAKSKTHHRFHNVKLFLKDYDVYVEMQATLKRFTTLKEFTEIENPKLSHDFYELVRAWKPTTEKGANLKKASERALQDINDIICEWADEKEIKEKADRYDSSIDVNSLILPAPLELVADKLAKFVHDILALWKPQAAKGKAIYQVLFLFYKEIVLGKDAMVIRRRYVVEEVVEYVPENNNQQSLVSNANPSLPSIVVINNQLK
ncbi:vcbs repeat-containing protein [Reticulomyxa filosa]|uniref:Vcbs repeat-containing protein n=1 Tax=Reticulomyxa filosa TaxID=46433 RepID=X6NNP0_RETFI|nr:vcbs repeat-containing protein [Reticulomyxa filosa]|eukprot:ETO26992.1 vcbs repeat-containing protein [Reticulomyxa filosa]